MASEKRCEVCVWWVKTNMHGTEGKCKRKNKMTKWNQGCPDQFVRK